MEREKTPLSIKSDASRRISATSDHASREVDGLGGEDAVEEGEGRAQHRVVQRRQQRHVPELGSSRLISALISAHLGAHLGS